MLNAYTPPIAVALGCVAPKLNPNESARLSARTAAKDLSRGLGLADIALASIRASATNGLRIQRQLKTGWIIR